VVVTTRSTTVAGVARAAAATAVAIATVIATTVAITVLFAALTVVGTTRSTTVAGVARAVAATVTAAAIATVIATTVAITDLFAALMVVVESMVSTENTESMVNTAAVSVTRSIAAVAAAVAAPVAKEEVETLSVAITALRPQKVMEVAPHRIRHKPRLPTTTVLPLSNTEEEARLQIRKNTECQCLVMAVVGTAAMGTDTGMAVTSITSIIAVAWRVTPVKVLVVCMDLVVTDITSTSTIAVAWEVVQAKEVESMESMGMAEDIIWEVMVVKAAIVNQVLMVDKCQQAQLRCIKRMHE